VYLILVPHNAAIATIITMRVDQTLTLGNFLQRRKKVQGPHPLPPLERLVEDAETYRFPVVDDEDEIDDDGC
jgi:hypothetical protein